MNIFLDYSNIDECLYAKVVLAVFFNRQMLLTYVKKKKFSKKQLTVSYEKLTDIAAALIHKKHKLSTEQKLFFKLVIEVEKAFPMLI